MNQGIKEKELPDKFASDDYQVLLVAEKYQTGFDQPLFHTMYVDKRLSGIQAIQTLSRLNRICAGKEDTFILDFVNQAEDIFTSFKPYYEDTPVDPLVDPHHLYELQHNLLEPAVFFEAEVDEFAGIYFKPRLKETVHDHGKMNGVLDLAVEHFKALPQPEQEDFKSKCVSFRNLYGFLAQIIPYQDSDLEKLYIYLRFLLTKLPRRKADDSISIEDEVNLSYYRLQKISEGQIDLTPKEAKPLKAPGDVGTGAPDEEVQLSQLIDLLNERFGTDFTPADQLFFDQISKEAMQDEHLQQAARVNTVDDFKYLFDKAFEGLVIDRMEGNAEIFNKLMGDDEFKALVADNLLNQACLSGCHTHLLDIVVMFIGIKFGLRWVLCVDNQHTTCSACVRKPDKHGIKFITPSRPIFPKPTTIPSNENTKRKRIHKQRRTLIASAITR